MKGTKLWQAPGSPVIQGRSRDQRPFLNVWLYSLLIASAVLYALLVAVSVFPGTDAFTTDFALSNSLALLGVAMPGVLLGSLAGTGFARAIGTRRAWIGGWVGGVVFGIISIALLASNISLRGIIFT